MLAAEGRQPLCTRVAVLRIYCTYKETIESSQSKPKWRNVGKLAFNNHLQIMAQ